MAGILIIEYVILSRVEEDVLVCTMCPASMFTSRKGALVPPKERTDYEAGRLRKAAAKNIAAATLRST